MKKSRHKRTKRTVERPIFEGIRKPLAPPGHALSHAKPEERARPAMRKAKHKQKPGAEDGEE